MTTGVIEVRDFTKCHSCGHNVFIWSFTGWDTVTLDSEGAYQRKYKGEYEDSNIECAECTTEYIGDYE